MGRKNRPPTLQSTALNSRYHVELAEYSGLPRTPILNRRSSPARQTTPFTSHSKGLELAKRAYPRIATLRYQEKCTARSLG
eukprot:5473048-Amphidinium_carterae.1